MTTAGSPVAGLSAAVDALLDVECWALSDGDLGVDLLVLERQAGRLEAVRLLAEVDGRETPASGGRRSPAHRAGRRSEQAAEHVGLAGPLAATAAALAAGDIIGDHAAVVHRTVTTLAAGIDAATCEEDESFLVESRSSSSRPLRSTRANSPTPARLCVTDWTAKPAKSSRGRRTSRWCAARCAARRPTTGRGCCPGYSMRCRRRR